MPATQTFSVDAAGNPETVTSVSHCRFVNIRQNDLNAATLSFYVRAPFITSPQVLYPAGKTVILDLGRYLPAGTTVCFMEMVSGTDTFCAEES